MADNRIFVRRRGLRGNEYALAAGGNQARIEAHLVEFRDDLRAAFASPRYYVSDIARWVGATGTLGYAFLLRDTTKGCEWLFGFGGRSDSSAAGWLYQMWGNNSAATMATYFKLYTDVAWSNPSTNSNANGLIFFNFNYSTSTFAFGFDNTTELTWTTGDFHAPASSPYSAIASFMPSMTGRYHGIDLSNQVVSGQYNKSAIIYDEPRGALCFEMTFGSSFGGGISVTSGKQCFPLNADGGLANALDTRQDCMFVVPRKATTNGAFNADESSAYMFVLFVRDNGTSVETTGRPVNIIKDFTRDNYLSGGAVQKRKLQINSSGYVKGYLDPELVCEAFPYSDGGFYCMPLALPDADNPMIKMHPQLCTFYKKNTAPFQVIPEPGLPIA